MADRTGQQLGNYHLLRLLGQGGFAEVYLGQHVYLHSQAALKVLRVALNNEDMESFAKEARILASLNHPHIVRVLDFAVEQGTPFLVMEYAANGTLRQHHSSGSRLPSETVVRYVRQVASALQYAHDQHLVHRDVKPENMLFGSRNELLLSDFGLATVISHSTDHSTQAIGASLAGTTAYLSPEQLQGKPQPASDQYALGIVVYEWFCGKRPFSGSPIEIAMQHISTPPPPLRAQFPGISPLLEEVVMRALAKEPQQRFTSVQDFATSLERAYQYTLQPRFSFAPSEGSVAVQGILKPGPMWKAPTIFTPLIGRDQEVADLCAWLKQPELRLLTLHGTGGIGKTRLSMQVAREIQSYFADGVCFIYLAGVREPALVVPSIAQELGIQEIGAQPILEQVKVALRDKHFLLLLDNFEQVVITAPFIEELLAACLHLKIVVTSREILHLQAERVFPVPPLGLPNLNQHLEDEAFAQYAAIALFVERAQAVQPAFRLTQANAQVIAEICVRLDGHPLAIELAAARSKVLPPQELLARLSQPFQVLTGGARTQPLRHQTLHNTLQWSYDLLNTEEQRFFRRLSVFVWGWTLEALEAVEKLLDPQADASALDGVTSLLDKSLLVQSIREGEEPRLQMLLTVREYGLERLRASGEAEQVQRAHAAYFLALAEEAEPHIKGAAQVTWLGRLELAQENTRTALTWLIERGEADSALRLCGALWWFWHLRGYWSEGQRWLEGALGIAQAEESQMARTRALYGAGTLAYDQDDYTTARSLLTEGVQLCRTLGRQRELATALGALGVLMHMQGDHATARPLLAESEALCRTVGSKWDLAYFLRKFGQRALAEGNLMQAETYAQESLNLARELGDKSLVATAVLTFASIAEVQGNLSQAGARTREGLTLARELGDKALIALALQNLGYLASLQDDLPQAAIRTREGLAIARELGDKLSINRALHNLGYIAWRQGDIKQAAAWYREGLSLAQEIGDVTQIGWHLIGLASVAEAKGQPWRATCLLGAAESRLDVNVSMNAIEQTNYTRLVESLRNTLGEKASAAAWAQGRTMTPEQARTASEQPPVSQTPAPPERTLTTLTYPAGLTAREVEILCLIARGNKVDQMAAQLVISPRTVSTHITSIYRKINVTTRSAATLYAIEHNLCAGLWARSQRTIRP